jgi:predicted ribosome quality control (RQC) complex YloA/Tae2 family protein
MIRHYFTLIHICKELKKIEGMKLAECFTQDKGILIMIFFDGKREIVVEFSTIPNIDSLFIRKRFSRARKNTLDLFRELWDKELGRVDLIESERIIKFDFGDYDLFFILFGGSRNNCFLVKDSTILDSFKNTSNYAGKDLVIEKGNTKQLSEFPEDVKIETALSKCDLLLGKYYAREICKRLQIDPKNKLENITKEEFKTIISIAEELRVECIESKKYYLYKTDRKDWLLSLIPLQRNWELAEQYNSASEAVQQRIFNTIRDGSFRSLYNELSNLLKRENEKVQINLSHIKQSDKTKERADNYRNWADLLIAQQNTKLKPGEKYEIEDWEGNKIAVPLDPKLNLIQNSEKYYEKASKSLQSIKERKRMLPKLLDRKEKVQTLLTLLDKAITVKELTNIKKKLTELPGVRMNTETQDKESKFRTFDLGEGYTLYVGKNAANNDELTMKFAKPNDLWFHARGAGGSHVVLRLDKGDKPGKHIIEKAASLAAYYSQQRKAKLTPVAYTYKKYVRKPKGANPGTVILSKEDVIMSKPKSPEEILS